MKPPVEPRSARATDPAREPRPGPRAPWDPRRVALVVGGAVAVGLAFLGAALPLLPTAPFVLLAGGCFARAWPRADRWLYDHKVFGPFRRMGGDQPAMTRRFKLGTILVVVASFGTTLALTTLPTWARATLVALCACVVLVIARQETLD